MPIDWKRKLGASGSSVVAIGKMAFDKNVERRLVLSLGLVITSDQKERERNTFSRRACVKEHVRERESV